MYCSSHGKVKNVHCDRLRTAPDALLSGLCAEFASKEGTFVLFKKPFEQYIEGFFGYSEDYFRIPLKEIDQHSEVFLLHPFEHTSVGCYALRPALHITLRGHELGYTNRKGSHRKWQLFFSKPPSSSFELPVGTDSLETQSACLSQQMYSELVQSALSSIAEKKLRKVVLSRRKEVAHSKQSIQLFMQLSELYAHAFTYIFSAPDLGVWVGASPELLLKQNGSSLESMAMAATRALPTSGSIHELKWSSKERSEQKFVRDYIAKQLREVPSIKLQKSYTETVRAGDLLHLCTFFEARATEVEERGIELLQHLHPTPALCGYPSSEALEFVRAHEPSPRGLYGGFLGPIYSPTDYQIYVNIRSAQLYKSTACIYTGAGIVAGSTPYKEWIETELKAHTIAKLLHS